MRGYKILYAGVFALAITLGYMVAASGTPVGAITIPAVFGLVVTALGLLQRPNSEVPADTHCTPKVANGLPLDSSTTTAIAQTVPMRFGFMLLSFSLGFCLGLVIGAKARLELWLSPHPESMQLTWLRHNLPEPPSGEAAFYWLYVQNILQERGISDDQVKALYLIQSKNWALRASINSQPVATSTTKAASATQESSTNSSGYILDEVMKQMQTGKPIVNHPPPKETPNKIPS